MTAAAMASPMSSPLTPRRTGAVAGTAREGAAAVVVVVRVAVVVAVPGRGAVAGAAGAAVAGLGGVGAGGAAAAEAAAGAAGAAPGTLGSLIVAVGLGGVGRLMRTVSFFGWTFAGSGLGGTPPPGTFGVLSAIVFRQCKLGLPPRTVKRYSRAN
jgi:hypothetical protein